MKLTFVLLMFIVIARCQENENLFEIKNENLQITSLLPQAVVSMGTDASVPIGYVKVIVTSPNTVSMQSKEHEDYQEIEISIQSGSVGYTSEPSSSASFTSASISITIAGLFICMSVFKRNYLLMLGFAGMILIVTNQCLASETSKVVVYINPEQDVNSIRLYSSAASIISADLFNVGDIQCANDGSDRLRKCAEALCDFNSDCFSSTFDARVGVLLPQSGDFEKTGRDMLKSLQFGVNYFGEQFPRIQLIAADTESNADVALSIVKEMYDSGIRIFIGPVLSAELLSVLDWSLEQDEIPIFVSPGGTSTILDSYSNLFRLLPDNAHQSVVICAYIAALGQDASSSTVYAVVRDDAYGDDLYQQMLNIASTYRIDLKLASEYNPNDISAASAAAPIISQLVNQIQSDSQASTGQKLVLFISFEEIQYFLEAASGTELENYRWLAVDVALNSQVVSSPASLNTARKVGLYTPQYSGSRVENGGIRFAFFQALQSEGISLLAPFAFDSLLLLFNTMQYIEDTSVATVQSQIPVVSNFLYGVSGWLRLEQNMRFDGEFNVAMIVPESRVLPSIWGLNSRIRLTPFSSSIPGQLPFTLIIDPYPLYQVSSDLFGCSSELLINARYYEADFTETEINFQTQPGEIVAFPSYGNITLEISCDSHLLLMACPQAGENVACIIAGNSNSPEKAGELTNAVFVCGLEVGACVSSAGWLCAFGAGACIASAADACCEYLGFGFCCSVP